MNCITRYGRRGSINLNADHDQCSPRHHNEHHTHVPSGCCEDLPCLGRQSDHRTCADSSNRGWRYARNEHRHTGPHNGHSCAHQCGNSGATCVVALNMSSCAQDEHVTNQRHNQQPQTTHHHHHHHYNNDNNDKGSHFQSVYRVNRNCHNCGLQYTVSVSGATPFSSQPSRRSGAPGAVQCFCPQFHHISPNHTTTTTTTTTTTAAATCELGPGAEYPFSLAAATPEICCPACGVMDRPGGKGGASGYRHVLPLRNGPVAVTFEY